MKENFKFLEAEEKPKSLLTEILRHWERKKSRKNGSSETDLERKGGD